MTTSGVVDGIARGQPVDRNLIVGIGETGAGLAGDRRLSTVVIGIPRRIGDGLQSRCSGVKTGSTKADLKRCSKVPRSRRRGGIPLRTSGWNMGALLKSLVGQAV